MSAKPITSASVKAELLAIFYERIEAGPPRDVTEGLFQAFGEVLSHMAAPREAAAYLRREARRIESMATTPTTETRQ